MIDWASASGARYVVRQSMRYTYPGPIEDLRHRLVVVPPERHGSQRRIHERLSIFPPVPVYRGPDRFGNTIARLYVTRVERTLDIDFESTVERHGLEPHEVARRWIDLSVFRVPTALTTPDDAILDQARRLRAQTDSDIEFAMAINTYLHEAMTYAPDVTDVGTTAAQAFAMRAGVCQDYAHVMLAMARSCGLAARYVSGHVIGEGGTHAWVEILLPGSDTRSAVAWPFDPTHNRRDSYEHIVIAVGRDYRDVAPTAGTFRASHNGVLTARKTVDVTSVQ